MELLLIVTLPTLITALAISCANITFLMHQLAVVAYGRKMQSDLFFQKMLNIFHMQ